MEDGRFMQSRLLDFYGALLTDKQRECFELHYNEDLSLAEIAEQSGISRQGVWDNIRRAELTMRDIEAKTGLVRRFSQMEACLDGLKARMEAMSAAGEGQARVIAAQALEDIAALEREG